MKEVSVIIPLLNEAESLGELHQWVVKVLEKEKLSYEILFIDDGSTDASWKVIRDIQAANSNVKAIRFLRNYGKSQALHAGFNKSQGTVVFTMDADLQDNPEELPGLYRMIKEEGYDLVSGWKKKRYDSVLAKNIPSKLFNAAARVTSGVQLNDFNCGLKAYKAEVVKNINVYGEMHRYIPVLAKNEGFDNIGEKVVQHQARKYGQTKFGINRFANGFLDLITIWFTSKFGKRPMHFFGLIGTLLFFIGFLFALYLGFDKLFLNQSGRLITQRPQFYIALTSMVLGTQFFLAGFLGEIILQDKSKQQERYKIAEII